MNRTQRQNTCTKEQTTSRRSFLGQTGAATLGIITTASGNSLTRENNNVLHLGLVGCGGRGTGAARQALSADPNTRLVAMADAFEDQLEKSLHNLSKAEKVSKRVSVSRDRRFVGLDAYQRLLDTDVDIVLLATPTHFRPIHVKATINSGRHVFAEKPVAVDGPGIRSILESAREADKRNLSLVSGLCWRYETGMGKIIDQIHQGALGEIVTIQSTRFNTYSRIFPRQAGMTEIEWQLRNWYNFTWTSGDFIVEQFVHELDKIAWLMGDEYPISCTATGGRQARTGRGTGNIYDHFSAIFEYANGVKYYAATRQQPRSSSLFVDLVYGTEGQANLMDYRITGKNPWNWTHKRTDMHQLEHNAMYAALRRGKTINNGNYMAKSTLMGIMARMSAYTGQTLSWDQVMNSREDLSPESYSWNARPPEQTVAIPGKTRFI